MSKEIFFIRQVLKKVLPNFALNLYRKYRRKILVLKDDYRFKRIESAEQIFAEIYIKKLWGKGQDKYFSGHGSHDELYVSPYVAEIINFFKGNPQVQTVLDLGCGDFNVGSRICDYVNKYIAVDIVMELIEANKIKFADLGNVNFYTLNAVFDDWPIADVVIIRQVLQHLSNEDIHKILEKCKYYKYLIVTEYIPKGVFIPNLNQPTGRYSRVARGIKSGISLAHPPFNLMHLEKNTLCHIEDETGFLVTEAYRFK